MRDFRKFDVWNDGMKKVVSTYQLVSTFPVEERFGLKSQMSRSAVSIPSNIAEGCSRSSERDFKRFLEIAIGSAFELETQTRIAYEIGFISKTQLDNEIRQLDALQKKINALITRIKTSQANS